MNVEDGIKYARDVSSGEINVCRDVMLACQRFLNQYENKEWEWVFDNRVPAHVLHFASNLRHTKGPDAGKPIVLEPFQILLVCAIYGFRSKKDIMKRMVTDVILFIPRKAGKSTLTAVIALYELLCGESGSEVFTLATNREQATIVFDAAKGFVENMPIDLQALFNLSKYEIKKVGDSQSMFKALSRDTKKRETERTLLALSWTRRQQSWIETPLKFCIRVWLPVRIRCVYTSLPPVSQKTPNSTKICKCSKLCSMARLRTIPVGLDFSMV